MITAEQVAELNAEAIYLRAARVASKTLYDAHGDFASDVFEAERVLELQAPDMAALIATQDAEIKRLRELCDRALGALSPAYDGATKEEIIEMWEIEEVMQALTKSEATNG